MNKLPGNHGAATVDDIGLINQAVFFNDEEWTRTGKARKGSRPLVNPVEFAGALDVDKPGKGIFALITPNQSGNTTISIQLDDRLDFLMNAASFVNGFGPNTLMTISKYRRGLCRNVKLGGPVYAGTYLGVRASFINTVEQIMVEGCSGDTFINSDCLYLGAYPTLTAIWIVQGNHITGASGTDDTYFTVDNFGTAENVQTMTDARILSSTTAQITVTGAFPGGAPTTANKITIADTQIEAVDGTSINLNQKWVVTGVAGNVITLGMDTSGGDVLKNIVNQTFPIVADVTSGKAWVIGVSGVGNVQGSHSDALVQIQGGRFYGGFSHNNYAEGNYTPGGINVNRFAEYTNVLVKFNQSLREPQERRSIACKMGSITTAVNETIILSGYHIDATDRPWVVSPPVSPSVTETNAFTPFGAALKTTLDGYSALTYRNGVPNGPLIGGFVLNKATVRDYTPAGTYGPGGTHPGLTQELGTPITADTTGVSLSNASTNSGLAAGGDIGEVNILGFERANTIIDVTVTGTYANYFKFWGRVLQRGRLPLPVGSLNVEFTVKVYPIDPSPPHARGALAYTQVYTLPITVASTGSPTTIAAVTQTAPISSPASGVSVYTFAASPSGTANTVRSLYIPVSVFAGSARTITSMTYGGVACALVAGTLVTSGNMLSAVYKIDLGVPDGGSADIVLTMSGAVTGASIGLEAITGVGVVYDSVTFASATFTDPTPFTTYGAPGCLAIGYGGYSSAASSGNKRHLVAKQSVAALGAIAVAPAYTGSDFNIGGSFTETFDVQCGAVGGSPATAGGVLVLGPVT